MTVRRVTPEAPQPFRDDVSRRDFLRWMAAAIALSTMGACARAPREKIVPYVEAPERIVPGRPLHYASAIEIDGYARPVLVESHMARPTKIEGNPGHPASLGATDASTQAALLSLYDPDRSQNVLEHGRIATWDRFVAAAFAAMAQARASGGAGLRILTGAVTSPTLAAGIREVLERYPRARWRTVTAHGAAGERAGSRLAFGADWTPHYRFDRTARVLTLDADPLFHGPGAVRYAHDYAGRRRPQAGREASRLYAVESAVTVTGAMADHRLALPPSEVETATRALAAVLGVAAGPGAAPPPVRAWVHAAAEDLEAHPGESLVVAGAWSPPWMHALAHAMNERLGAFGRTVAFGPSPEAQPEGADAGLETLAAEIAAGDVEALVVLGVDAVYEAPADLDFSALLARVPWSVHLGMHADATAARCTWHVPQSHDLERWGDARAYDGTATLIQPLIQPLFAGRTAVEIAAVLAGEPAPDPHALLRATWRAQAPRDFEAWFERALHDGWIEDSGAPAQAAPQVAPGLERRLAGASPRSTATIGSGALEALFRPDPTIGSGAFANNPWLQELPKPISHLTWGNAATLGPATARALGVESGDVVRLELHGRAVDAPVWVEEGQAEGCALLPLGYGRGRAGRVAADHGFAAGRLRSSATPWRDAGLRLTPTGRRTTLATTRTHHPMEGHDFARLLTAGDVARTPGPDLPPPSLYPPARDDAEHAWGMAIDLDACIGCGACVVACQAENNVPVVGRDEVIRGREMHWIRIDSHPRTTAGGTHYVHQPVPCMHCEHAPCELVCPVTATVHDSEGLNQMIYNRCVGTRYCSNNCPYKVRRFNFHDYAGAEPHDALPRNPDVSVRARGVMEKCTYCVQRIDEARGVARDAGRPMRDGDVVTACQAVCPAQAIVFGDLNDPESEASRWKADPRGYALLGELGTRPRTTYLARVRNPNPALERS